MDSIYQTKNSSLRQDWRLICTERWARSNHVEKKQGDDFIRVEYNKAGIYFEIITWGVHFGAKGIDYFINESSGRQRCDRTFHWNDQMYTTTAASAFTNKRYVFQGVQALEKYDVKLYNNNKQVLYCQMKDPGSNYTNPVEFTYIP